MKKSIVHQFDLFRLFAFLLLMLPVLAIFCFGMVWLWQTEHVAYWLGVLAVCGILGYGLQQWLVQRDRKLLAESVTERNPDWPSSADEAWKRVQVLAETTDPLDWPLQNNSWVLKLGQQTLEIVADYYHPNVDKPVLELTVPHALLIIEYASRDLRHDIVEHVPFSDQLVIGDFVRMKRWKEKAGKFLDAYRVGRAVVNPVDALFGEVWRHLRERSFGMASNELHRWLLHAYIRKIGYYAIDLYSGRQPLKVDALTCNTVLSRDDVTKAENNTSNIQEPLRILVMGRTNTGKSSLINTLFDNPVAATYVIPGTTPSLIPYTLLREGLVQALIFDSPGCDSANFDYLEMKQSVLNADLILWASSINRPDRQSELQYLSDLRSFLFLQCNRRFPPLLIVATHIDQLHPVRNWNPPYDLMNPKDVKATNIQVAVGVLAKDFDVSIDQVIPVCLRHDAVYNVDDALWSAILNLQDEALRVRLYRCLDTQNQHRNLARRRQQLINAGRFLWKIPGALKKQ